MENRKIKAILQAHLDMVPQANEGIKHDFLTDPILLPYIDSDWVKANGTTLGADNGIGMASALAIRKLRFISPRSRSFTNHDRRTRNGRCY